MKLTLIGGGGVRGPLFVASALRRAERVGLEELCLMDIDAEKLAIFGGLCREVARRAGSPVRITTTTDARAALDGARHVVTTIRVGFEHGRVLDERIALRHGVLGQETTGPGGFAMALRSIPALLGYAELLDQVSPGAWLYSFTNPAGLVTQALRDAGFSRTIGICDGANVGQHAVADWLKIDPARLRAEVFGLNHLSWTRRVLLDGQDVLAPLLRDPAFLSGTMMKLFDPALVERIGMWLNEYLYYFYYAERAVASISADEMTRGEEIVELNQRLLAQLRAIGVEQNPDAGLRAFHAYQNRRHATYMHYAQPDGPTMEQADEELAASSQQSAVNEADGEGYAGVALGIVEAMETGVPLYTALNVPNEGAIDAMRPGDVVEVSCVVDRDGVRPLPIGAIPEPQELLMRSVKLYERLTVEAIRTRARGTAVAALMAHPLVLSYSRAKPLVDEYLFAHREWVGEWP
ncbi:MAG: 6-phospho-beta-glucosidase [Kouleothrix sp.]|nr:6-phospho-beta-glucosidase [Kouleothrix sp.]